MSGTVRVGAERWLAGIGQVAEAPDDTRPRRALVIAFALFVSVGGLLWGVTLAAFGLTQAAVIPSAYTVATALNIIVLRTTGRYQLFRVVQLIMTLLLPYLLLVVLGGFAASGAVVLWSLLAPLGALLTGSRREAVGWFAGYILLVVLSPFTALNEPWQGGLPEWAQVMLFTMNLVAVCGVAFLMLHYFVGKTDTAILENRDLLAEAHGARAAAESAAEAKSAFLANVSHELRTPLNAVIGMTSLLHATDLSGEQREYADTVRDSGEALLSLINDILDFSKIEADRLELEREPFVLRQVVEGALDLVAAKAADKALDLAYVLEDGVPEGIVGDPTRLRQILLNLLSNAIKFTEQGEVVVTVSAHPHHDGVELRFAVRDTGIGIPPDRRDRLFEVFTQVDASTTRRYGGTGLGLAISKRLAEQMGGTMDVDSEPGAGSTFWFTVVTQPAAVAAPGPDAADLLSGKRVLVVDDNATNRRILCLQAEGWGMAPQATGDPTEALAWVRAGELFDLAILDMQMPALDGVALARAIREVRPPDALPIVLLTSLGGRETIQAGDGEPPDFAAFMTKPIKQSQLHDALVTALAGTPARSQERVGPAEQAFDPDLGRRLPLRILLAEDNATNQKLALRLLGRLGYDADVVSDGAEAVRAVEQQSYDVVLMDIQMPEMDGLEATREIRRRRSGDGPRIIAMTANALASDRQECVAAGMDDYVAKPIRVDELVAALGRAAEATPSPDTARRSDTGNDVVDAAALERLLQNVGGDTAFLSELIDTFLDEAPHLLTQLRAAVVSQDANGVRLAAHPLKSNAADFGAQRLAGMFRTLEDHGREGNISAAAALIPDIEAEFARVTAALEGVRDG